ncbi:hypothetical protein EVAR_54758_1 [Eumeta japonica]|uniref:Uncharacterized protein n=1 Tax=Eumeta variegata TaxID=151549 RepID=A0A4C1YE46_EUMVA|nr:hypothetical protein EVAR_54758_1 [Eumeta japonica]
MHLAHTAPDAAEPAPSDVTPIGHRRAMSPSVSMDFAYRPRRGRAGRRICQFRSSSGDVNTRRVVLSMERRIDFHLYRALYERLRDMKLDAFEKIAPLEKDCGNGA